MIPQSLHTKYRPATLDDVVGQSHVKPALAAALSERSQQAFLFEGPSGTGKTTLARICAKELGCTEVIEIDAASNSGVDDMRKVADSQNYKSFLGGGTAFIVDECHRLSANAWDSLLKSIEEPPEGVYWFFATTEPHKVPKTVRTRCLSFLLQDVPYRPLLKLLAKIAQEEQFSVSEDVLDLAAEEANGSPRQAIMNLVAVKDCPTLSEAQVALSRAPGSKEAIDLCRLLSGQWTFAQAAAMLAEMGDVSAESIRMTVFHYYLKAALNGQVSAMIILDEFEKPANDRHKQGDILLRLTRIIARRSKHAKN